MSCSTAEIALCQVNMPGGGNAFSKDSPQFDRFVPGTPRSSGQQLGRQVGRALVQFQAADLSVAVAHRDGKLALGQAGAAAEVFEQIPKGGELFKGNGSTESRHF
jgi:hypothetical protein